MFFFPYLDVFWKIVITFASKQCIKLSSVRVYRETHEEGGGSLLFFLYTRRFHCSMIFLPYSVAF